MTDRVYIAAPLSTIPRVRDVASLCRAAGLHVVSTWHDSTLPGSSDPSHPEVRSRYARRNRFDLEHSDVVLALCDRETPRATLVEVGIALGKGIPVVYLHGPDGHGRCLGDSDDGVTRATSLYSALIHVTARMGNPHASMRVQTLGAW
jgi:nucleoside 2-deoxyribosyltransferase